MSTQNSTVNISTTSFRIMSFSQITNHPFIQLKLIQICGAQSSQSPFFFCILSATEKLRPL